MLLKVLEMDLVLGHRASGSLPSAQLLNIMVMPSSVGDENFRRRKLDRCMLVFFSLGYEICKALKEQRNTSAEHHASLVQLANTQWFGVKTAGLICPQSSRGGACFPLGSLCSLHVFLCLIYKYAFPIRRSYICVQRFIL